MDWISGAVYEIAYTNRYSAKTRRIIRVVETITVKRVETTVYIRGFCYLRNEERTFREDRILAAKLIARQEAAEEVFTGKPLPQAFHAAAVTEARVTTAFKNESAATIFSDTNQEESYGKDQQIAVSTQGAFPFSISYVNEPKPTKVSPYAGDYFKHKSGDQDGSWKRIKNHSRFWSLVGLILAIVAVFYVLKIIYSEEESGTSLGNAPNAVTVISQPVVPSVEEVKLGGCILRIHQDSTGTWYEVPARGYKGYDKAQAVLSIRRPNFINYTGIDDKVLMDRYFSADSDGNGKLSYVELEYFAHKVRTYVIYKHNETALRPDRFLAEGGGDCEDFALYIAGLLRFWGWQPYIACFDTPDKSDGHAVCFSYEGSGGFPQNYVYYTLTGKSAWDGTPLPDGKYISIDFEHVGEVLDVEKKGYVLSDIFIPEKAWGIRM